MDVAEVGGSEGSFPKSLLAPRDYEYVNKPTSPSTHMGRALPTNGIQIQRHTLNTGFRDQGGVF